jgi:hypothetical protein
MADTAAALELAVEAAWRVKNSSKHRTTHDEEPGLCRGCRADADFDQTMRKLLIARRAARAAGKVSVLISADVAEAVVNWVKQGRPPVSLDLPAQYVAGLAMCELAEALGVDRNAGLTTEITPC